MSGSFLNSLAHLLDPLPLQKLFKLSILPRISRITTLSLQDIHFHLCLIGYPSAFPLLSSLLLSDAPLVPSEQSSFSDLFSLQLLPFFFLYVPFPLFLRSTVLLFAAQSPSDDAPNIDVLFSKVSPTSFTKYRIFLAFLSRAISPISLFFLVTTSHLSPHLFLFSDCLAVDFF